MTNRLGRNWNNYHAECVPGDAPEVQIEESRRAFYAGANAVMAIVAELSEDHVSYEQRARVLRELADEQQGHRATLKRKPPTETVTPLRDLMRRETDKALRITEGDIERAALLLGIGRATLYRRLAKEKTSRDASVPLTVQMAVEPRFPGDSCVDGEHAPEDEAR